MEKSRFFNAELAAANKLKKPKNKKIKKEVKKEVKKEIKFNSNAKITPAGKFLRSFGGRAGQFLGVGKQAGSYLGGVVSKIFGQGDYKIQKNSFNNGGPPAFAALNSGTRLAHREYVQEVFSSQAFANTTFDINPNNSTLFPWLAQIAPYYEEYEFHGLVFYFNTLSGDAVASTNPALGCVGMTTVYDPTDPPLSSKKECEEYVGVTAGVPARDVVHGVECKRNSNVLSRLYVLPSGDTLVNPEDKKFYSHGTLNLFTEGQQTTGNSMGELWVSYDISFYNPKILPNGTVNTVASSFNLDDTDVYTATAILGTSPLSGLGNLGATYAATSGQGTFTLPAGTAPGVYSVIVSTTYPSTPGSGFYQIAATSANIITAVGMFDDFSEPQAPGNGSTRSWQSTCVYFQKLDAFAATFNLNYNSTVPTGYANIDVYISNFSLSAVPPGAGLMSTFRSKILKARELATDKLYARLLHQIRLELKPKPDYDEVETPISVLTTREPVLLRKAVQRA